MMMDGPFVLVSFLRTWSFACSFFPFVQRTPNSKTSRKKNGITVLYKICYHDDDVVVITVL